MLSQECITYLKRTPSVSLLTIAADPYEASRLLSEELQSIFGLQCSRIPLSVTEYNLADYIARLTKQSILVLSNAESRSLEFLALLFRIQAMTNHFLVVGSESYEPLRSFANRIGFILDANLDDNSPENSLMQELIASSFVDVLANRAERVGMNQSEISKFILQPQLLLRNISLSSNTQEEKKPDSKDEIEDTNSASGTNAADEKIFEKLELPFEEKNKSSRSVRIRNPFRGSSNTKHISNIGRSVDHSRVRSSKNGRFSVYQTILAASPYQLMRRKNALTEQALYIESEDIRRYPFRATTNKLAIIILDSSGSMAASSRIRFAKGFVEQLLQHSYRSRQYASLIVARGNESSVVVMPTRSIAKISSALKIVPTGGGTPIASAIQSAINVNLVLRRKLQSVQTEIIFITDGKANVSLNSSESVNNELKQLGEICSKEKIVLTIADVAKRSDSAKTLAALLGAQYSFYTNDLTPSHIA